MSHYSRDLDIVVGGCHNLLDPPAPAYSNLTVRRAFIVWMHCGQQNKFRDVCNYYHYLEAMEEKLSPADRAASRRQELDLFSNLPPTSAFLKRYYPNLYPERPVEPHYINKLESIKNEKCIFKLEGFHDIKQTGVTTTEIFEVSKIIRQYCQTHNLTLRKFLEEFQQYAAKCDIKESVGNVAAYIKRKMVEAELETVENIPTNFSFLNGSSDSIEPELLPEVPQVVPQEKSLESQQLKLLLGVSPKSSDTEESTEHLNGNGSGDSCAEFFKLFKNQNGLENKCTSYSHLPPTFEDFAKVLDQNRFRSKSVEPGGKNKIVLANKTFKRNQDVILCEPHIKVTNLANVREIGNLLENF